MNSNHTCLTVISLDSALKKDYPQVFLKACKFIEKKVVRHIIDDILFIDLECSPDDSEEE